MLTKKDVQTIREVIREEVPAIVKAEVPTILKAEVPRIVREINDEELIPSLLEALPHLIRGEIAPLRTELRDILTNHESRIRHLEKDIEVN